MRVALVTGEYPPAPGGIGDYTARLAHALQERGLEPLIVTADLPPAMRTAAGEPRDTDTSPPVVRLPTTWSWNSGARLCRALAPLAPDVVHLQYQAGAFGQRAAVHLLPAQIKRRLRVPVVVTAHDLLLPYLFPRADLLRRRLTHHMLHSAAAVIVTNDEDQGRLGGTVAPDRQHAGDRNLRSHLIPIGSNIDPQPPTGYTRDGWRSAHGLAGASVIGYFGLLSPSKGVIELVEAVAQLDPATRLVIIGGAATNAGERGYAAAVQNALAVHGLAERVLWTGPCTAEEVSAYLLACDVLALPFLDGASYRRGSLLAALAHGCAVVTTQPRSAIHPPLEDGVAACLVPAATPAQLAIALNTLLADAALRRHIGRGGQELAAHFGWPAIAAAHEVVYNELI